MGHDESGVIPLRHSVLGQDVSGAVVVGHDVSGAIPLGHNVLGQDVRGVSGCGARR